MNGILQDYKNQGNEMNMKSIVIGTVLAAIGSLAANAATLDTVKSRGTVKCGVAPNIPGFAYTGADGSFQGFDVAICQAVAAAALGDAKKVEVVPLSPRDAFASLQTGVVDLLAHRFTMTYNRNAGKEGFDFPLIFYYDGQGFMVRKSAGVKSAKELGGASICVAQGTTTEKNIADYFRSQNLQVQTVTFADLDEARRAYDEGRCDAWSNDRSNLAARGQGLKSPDEHVVLPETISKETSGPIVRKDDPLWGDLVRWTLFTMINSEELGVSSQNVDQAKAGSDNPEVRRMLGAEDNASQKLGLEPSWGYNVIKQVGNYGEIFDRNLGSNSKLKLDRGANALWNKGGRLFAPPLR
jgi:general L-amino acid transport system substrate-binding protein